MKETMRKTHIRLCSVLLALVMLISAAALAACNGRQDGSDGTSSGEATSEPVPAEKALTIFADGKMNFRIIRPVKTSDAVVKAAMDLASQLSKYFGVEITAERDVLFPAAENTDTFEILVGDTDRPESAEAVKGLKTRDFACAIYGNKIVLNGTSAAMVTRAVNSFVDSVILPKVADGAKVFEMTPDDSRIVRSAYRIQECTVLGTDLSEYTLVYPDAGPFSAQRTAILLSNYVEEKAGVKMPVVSDKTEAAAHEIRIGKTSRGGISLTDYKLGEYSGAIVDGTLCFGAGNLFGYMNLYKYFTDTLFNDTTVTVSDGFKASGDGSPEEEAEFSVKRDGEFRVMFFNVLGNCDMSVVPTQQRNQTAAEALIALAPDAFGLQECSHNSRGASSIIKTLAASGYIEVDATATNSNKVNYTPLLYNKNKLRVIDKGYHLYSDGAGDKSKSITWGVFEDIATGKRFAVCSTHFAWKADADAARMKDAAQLLEVNNTIKQKYDCPIISGGDFNCKIASSPFKALTQGGMVDIYNIAAVKENSNTTHTYPEYDKEKGLYLKIFTTQKNYTDAIDHSLLYNGDKVTPQRFDVIKLEYTLISADHCPLLIDFDLAK